MGLDVYLYKADRPIIEVRKAKEKAERDYEEISNEVLKWFGVDKFEALTKAQHGDYFGGIKAACRERGLGEYGEPEGLEEKIEIDSSRWPKSYFKVGYFRSSYNGGGLNRVMSRFGLPSLDDMFPVENLETGEGFDANPPSGGDEYYRTVNWRWSRDKAAKALTDFRAALEERGPYSVTTIQENPFGGSPDMPKSEEDALRLYQRGAPAQRIARAAPVGERPLQQPPRRVHSRRHGSRSDVPRPLRQFRRGQADHVHRDEGQAVQGRRDRRGDAAVRVVRPLAGDRGRDLRLRPRAAGPRALLLSLEWLTVVEKGMRRSSCPSN